MQVELDHIVSSIGNKNGHGKDLYNKEKEKVVNGVFGNKDTQRQGRNRDESCSEGIRGPSEEMHVEDNAAHNVSIDMEGQKEPSVLINENTMQNDIFRNGIMRLILKREPSVLQVWVKLKNVPMEARTKKGISVLASNQGRPIIMDAITTMMCNQWVERFGFARVHVEINATKECKDSIEDILKENNSEADMGNRNEENVNKVQKEDVNKGQKEDGKNLDTMKSKARKNANGKWNVNQNVMDYIKVSANKYVVLQEDYNEEFSPYISPIKQTEVDKAIEKDDLEIQEDVFDDYYKIGEFLKVNELRNEWKNVLAEGGVDGLFDQ
uniref:RNA-directed DNA polymerase, eukaryota, reverse transcriptase zinc-binding domain protein n=1 Tax=Tanacetum cinerariifolium TaxID=118510 RepID=A0A6L2N1C8_TANCI|nr:RNA-directed DNA polymerase, eukaryota, reverse transcriptase zinc-binding domain protein [Tanacetum cinerariifolium]